MIEIAGADKTAQFLPNVSLRRFGENPYGEPLYRVVWSDSRVFLVGEKSTGKWRRIPLYPGQHNWTLEKWLSPEAFAGSRSGWELQEASNETMLGAYPDRGEYQHCYFFPAEPGELVVAEVISWIEAGRKYTTAQKKAALVGEREKQDQAHVDRAMDIWRNAQGAFNNKPSNIHPGKRTADDVKFKYAAEDVGLKTGDGKFFQK